ncbi:MAG: CBS domain-containing protein [Phycisphaerales bacterium]|nr:MAG: CBS domain-containing protein [Phycisphaerales bacterium]
MNREVVSVRPCDTVRSVIQALHRNNVSCVAVLDEATVVGIITERDILVSIARDGGAFTCLLVVHGGKPVGMLTEKDILKRVVVLGKAPKRTQVADVMSFPILSVPPTYSVFSAGKKMDEMHIHRLVVMTGRDVCGIVTKTDVMKAVRKKVRHDQTERLQQLDRSDNPACVLDGTGTIIHVNSAFLDLFESDRSDDFIGQSFLPDRFWACLEGTGTALSSLGREDLTVRQFALRTARNQEIRVVLFSTLTKGFDGKVKGRQVVFYDLTALMSGASAPAGATATVKS